MKGSCLCRSVSFEIDGRIHSARYCHCQNCRKFSGTAWAAWGLIQADQLRVSPADASVTRYNSGGGFRVFCTVCGSPLWFEPAELPHYRGVPLGAIDDGEVPKPEMHAWTRSKVAWASVSDDLPRHQTRPQRSVTSPP
jgi:hypothetical protein